MKHQTKSVQMKLADLPAGRRPFPSCAVQFAHARPSLPRDFDDWLHAEYEYLAEQECPTGTHQQAEAPEAGDDFQLTPGEESATP